MPLSYREICSCLAGRRLPAAIVDLDALERNVARVVQLVGPRATPVRIASKSVRVPKLLAHIIEQGEGLLRGLMCFSVEEAEFLAGRGFDDLLVAYPPFQHCDIERAAALTKRGVTLSVVSDCRDSIDRISSIASAQQTEMRVVLGADMSLRLAGGRVHLGVRRSPLHTPAEVVDLARYAAARPGVRFHGLLGYEAQVAGLGDDNPFTRLQNPANALVKRASIAQVARRRRAMVEALTANGLPPQLVNGGGTGSLDTTTPDTGVTEVTAGSAFFKPHLFDYYKNAHTRALEPACYFALEVTRKPAPDMVTCLGGGYVASGPPGLDKVPLPWLPRGLRLLPDECCGEVQTPLRMTTRGATPPIDLALGDPIIFRHAKGGELAERFRQMLLVRGSEVVDSVNTYRGDGQCFF